MRKCMLLPLILVAELAGAQDIELNYAVSYSFVKCADINVKITESQHFVKVSATGKSCGVAGFLFKVDEKYDCYIDKDNGNMPSRVDKVSKSGASAIRITLDFDHERNTVSNSVGGVYDVPPFTYDFLSGLVLISGCDFFNGADTRSVNIFFDNSPCVLHVKSCGNTLIGNVDCRQLELTVTKPVPDAKPRKFISLIPAGAVHHLWISDCPNPVLVCAQIGLVAGSLKVELKPRH